MRKKLDVLSMTKIALCAAVISVLSYFVIPLPFTPIVLSMQTVMVNLVGLIFEPREAAYTIVIYLIMGFVGLPVFSGGTAGPGKLLGPTGGFYFGFLFAVIAISKWKGRKSSFVRYTLVTVCIGIPIEHLCAVFFICLHNGFDVRAAVMTVSAPFILGDIIKCMIASMIGAKIYYDIKRAG